MTWMDWYNASLTQTGVSPNIGPLVEFQGLRNVYDFSRPHETPGVNWRVTEQRAFLINDCARYRDEYASNLARRKPTHGPFGRGRSELPPIATSQVAYTREWATLHKRALFPDGAGVEGSLLGGDYGSDANDSLAKSPQQLYDHDVITQPVMHGFQRRRLMELAQAARRRLMAASNAEQAKGSAGSGAYAANPEGGHGAVRDASMTYSVGNTQFGPADAGAAYCIMRHFKPKRVIEVGSGSSTRAMIAAFEQNLKEGFAVNLTSIEPFPDKLLRRVASKFGRLVEARAENVPLSVFQELEPGDVLFIDSSHILRIDTEIIPLFLNVLPALPKGVIVHVHDIYLPKPYPYKFYQLRWFWTEQYVLHALLQHSDRYEIILANHFLMMCLGEMDAYAAAMGVLFDEQVIAFDDNDKRKFPPPSSFWFKIK